MKNFTINAESRTDIGKGASRRLRHTNKFPAVIYGAGQDPQALTMSHDEILKHLDDEAFYTSILTIKIDGKETRAVAKDIQRHAYKPKVLHMDLQRISTSEKITMHVPIHFLGAETAPGVKLGGIMSHLMSDIEVSCLAKDLPEYIEIDVSGLNVGDTLHISDLALPEGVTSVELSHGEDHDQPIVAVQKARGMKADEETSEGESEE